MKLGTYAGVRIDVAVDSATAVLELARVTFDVECVSFEFNGRLIYVWHGETREQTLERAMGALNR